MAVSRIMEVSFTSPVLVLMEQIIMVSVREDSSLVRASLPSRSTFIHSEGRFSLMERSVTCTICS